ncbi:MAG: hypothetical protein ACI9R7_000290, partial [Lysobacterales bacterium]
MRTIAPTLWYAWSLTETTFEMVHAMQAHHRSYALVCMVANR